MKSYVLNHPFRDYAQVTECITKLKPAEFPQNAKGVWRKMYIDIPVGTSVVSLSHYGDFMVPTSSVGIMKIGSLTINDYKDLVIPTLCLSYSEIKISTNLAEPYRLEIRVYQIEDRMEFGGSGRIHCDDYIWHIRDNEKGIYCLSITHITGSSPMV